MISFSFYQPSYFSVPYWAKTWRHSPALLDQLPPPHEIKGSISQPHLFGGGAAWLARPASVRGAIGGDRIFVAFIDSESVAIATLWRLTTPTVGVNSFGLICYLIFVSLTYTFCLALKLG